MNIKKTKEGKFTIAVYLNDHQIESKKYNAHYIVELEPSKNTKKQFNHLVLINQDVPVLQDSKIVDYDKDLDVSCKSSLEDEALELAHELMFNYEYSKAG